MSKIMFGMILLLAGLVTVEGHGRLLDPVGRSSAWRYGFNTPQNVDDNALYCGGFNVSVSFSVVIKILVL